MFQRKKILKLSAVRKVPETITFQALGIIETLGSIISLGTSWIAEIIHWIIDVYKRQPHTIQVEEPQLELVDPVGSAQLVSETEETLTHINSSYTLNDYLLARGFANLYVLSLIHISWIPVSAMTSLAPKLTSNSLKPTFRMNLIG